MAALTENAGLLFRISADNADAVRKLVETEAAIKSTTANSTAGFKSLEAEIKNAGLALEATFSRQAGSFENNVKKFSTELGSLEANLKSGGASAAVYESRMKLLPAGIQEAVAAHVKFRQELEQATVQSKTFQQEIQGVAKQVGALSSVLPGSSSQVNGLGRSLGAIPGGAGLAVGAIAAVTAGAIAAAAALFEMTVKAGEQGLELKKLQLITGFSAAQVSALAAGAKEANVSFSTLTLPLKTFTVTLSNARDGNEKAIASLKRLGVTELNDVSVAFDQLSKHVGALGDSEERTKDLTLALGSRGIAALSPILDKMSGGFLNATAKAKELGMVLSQDDIDAAVKFNNTLKTVEVQLGVAVNKFAVAYGPQITAMLAAISRFLAENQDKWAKWGKEIGDDIHGVAYALDGLKTTLDVATLGVTSFFSKWELAESAIRSVTAAITNLVPGMETLKELKDILEQIGRIKERINADDVRLPAQVEGKSPVIDRINAQSGVFWSDETLQKFRDFQKKQEDDREKEREDIAKRTNAAQIESLKAHLAAALKAYEDYDTALKTQYEKTPDEAAFRAGLQGALERLKRQLPSIIPALEAAERVKQGADALPLEQKNLDEEQQKRVNDINAQTAKSFADMNKTITEGDKKAADERIKQAKKEADNKIAIATAQFAEARQQLENDHQLGIISEQNYVKAVGLAELSLLQLKRSLAIDPTTRSVLDLEIQTQILRNANGLVVVKQKQDDVETKLHANRVKHWAEYVKQLEAEIDKYDQLNDAEAERIKRQKELDAAKAKQLHEQGIVGSGSTPDVFATLHQGVLDNLSGTKATAAITGINLMKDAFAGLGQAVGAAVQSLVLYGNAGESVRKVTAQILASIAQQAAIQAIYELAQGFAALALAFFGIPNAGPSAAAHFQSAALYGVVAGVAAVAGRAVAGNAFKQQTASGGAGASSGASGTNPLTDANNPQNRFTEAFHGFTNQLAKIQDRTNVVLGAVEEQLNRFHETFGVVTAGHVVMAGAGDAGQQIFDAHKSILGTGNGAETFRRTLG